SELNRTVEDGMVPIKAASETNAPMTYGEQRHQHRIDQSRGVKSRVRKGEVVSKFSGAN
ncbi:hypothetical protein J6590_095741, partial [Homalodisca vitripennis]